MINVAALLLKMFARYWMRFAAFASAVVLIGVSAALLGAKLLEEGIEPIVIYVIDLDRSTESRLVMRSLDGGDGAFVRFVQAELPIDTIIAENEAAAVFVIPKDYAASVMNGENPPFTVTLNPRKPLSAALTQAYAKAFTDMLRAAQSGVYAALDFAEAQNDADLYDKTFTRVNLRFITTVLGRDNAFAVNSVSPTGEPVLAHYFYTTCVFVLMLMALLFSDILRNTLVMNANRLYMTGTGDIFAFVGAYAAVFAVYAVLCAICAFAGCSLFGEIALSRWILTAFELSSFALFCGLFFKAGATAGLGVFSFATVKLFLTGGIIPLAAMPDELRGIAVSFGVNYVYIVTFAALAFLALIAKFRIKPSE